MRSGAGLYHIKIAGTGMCVHIPFRLNPIASLAWLGKQLPCPVQYNEVASIQVAHTHPHTHTPRNSGADEMTMKVR